MPFTRTSLFLACLLPAAAVMALGSITVAQAQTATTAATQTVRGRIVDATTQQPLPGATVRLMGGSQGALTDEQGNFALTGVPIGRQVVQVNFVGYEPVTVPNVLVTTGKEVFLPVEMQERVIAADEVVISGAADPQAPVNEFTTVSSRAFNAEETGRFAGSRNDPSRMAANFAGVSGANDARNDIIVRGNSPLGLLWRMEGVDIPNPNHYSGTGNTGGPVSMLNNNLLEKSDFLTSAFPATYGNALGAVFDLRLRNGNSEKHEFLGQFGINGFEFGAEGPLNREAQSSYLVNYRYSNLEALQAAGFDFGTGSTIPRYQDVAFKLNFPLTKWGAFSVWGFGGVSRIEFLDSDIEDKTNEDALYGNGGFDQRVSNATGALGFSHRYFFGNRTTGRFNLTYSGTYNRFRNDSLNTERIFVAPQGGNELRQYRLGINYTLTHKFNAANNLAVGIRADQLQISFVDSNRLNGVMEITRNIEQERNWLLQGFAQFQHRFNDDLTANVGVNVQQFERKPAQIVVEPRLGLRYQVSSRSGLTAGFGVHHQIQPLWAYYYISPSYTPAELGGPNQLVNADMGFTRSLHYVLGYDYALSSNTRIKLETYYQDISDAPVQRFPSTFSLLNTGTDFGAEDRGFFVNEGTGRNYGLELTLERTFDRGLYYLLTTSLYRSFYTASDGVERPSAYDGGYVVNLLAGKEWKVNQRSVFIIDTKLTLAGGRRYTPLDLDASRAAGAPIFDESEPFSQRLDAYQRWDVKLGYRWNRPRVTHEFSIDLQNVLGRQNPFSQTYDRFRNELRTVNQIGFLPLPQYRITF